MNPQQPQVLNRLIVRQKLTMMQNRYVVHMAGPDGQSDGPVVGFAEQKRLALKEQVTIYTDETRQRVLAGFKARRVIDLSSEYDVLDHNGTPIGMFRKDFGASLMRSTWHLEQPGLPPIVGQERSSWVAVLRRFIESLSWLPYHFDFTINGHPGFSVDKQWGLRDHYVVDIPDPNLDRRLVIAMAVALDALQSR
ncbi:MAG TPA: hypothetical protein VFM37_02110 [Pseudonocardiaceae bacterium]|nr:hypothetical protein [Pseudonocardiaceae bacterium]